MRNAVYEHKARLVQLLGSDEQRQRWCSRYPRIEASPATAASSLPAAIDNALYYTELSGKWQTPLAA